MRSEREIKLKIKSMSELKNDGINDPDFYIGIINALKWVLDDDELGMSESE